VLAYLGICGPGDVYIHSPFVMYSWSSKARKAKQNFEHLHLSSIYSGPINT